MVFDLCPFHATHRRIALQAFLEIESPVVDRSMSSVLPTPSRFLLTFPAWTVHLIMHLAGRAWTKYEILPDWIIQREASGMYSWLYANYLAIRWRLFRPYENYEHLWSCLMNTYKSIRMYPASSVARIGYISATTFTRYSQPSRNTDSIRHVAKISMLLLQWYYLTFDLTYEFFGSLKILEINGFISSSGFHCF